MDVILRDHNHPLRQELHSHADDLAKQKFSEIANLLADSRDQRAEIERLQKRDDERTGTINEAMADEIEKLRDECPRGVVFGWCCKPNHR